jgi:hypothetical protein
LPDKTDTGRIESSLEAKGIKQGLEFTPEGDKLFVGSAIVGRIEVFDVVGDYELRKSAEDQKLLTTAPLRFPR